MLPDAPTTLTVILPAYVYQEYNDDTDVPWFFFAYNQIAQDYMTWLATTCLANYTQDPVSGDLLDWVGRGRYGIARPSLPYGYLERIGQFNTAPYNELAYNETTVINPEGAGQSYATTDDTYRRCMTWALFTGDGKVFNIRWLKRRVMRFLLGINGINFNVDQTYRISVTFGPGDQANIVIINGVTTVTGGATYNGMGYNDAQFPYNDVALEFTPFSPFAAAQLLKAAIDAGVLELPFQYTWVVQITP
jgi:hypothetical protein